VSDCASKAFSSCQPSPLCITDSMGVTTTTSRLIPTSPRTKFVKSVAAGTEPLPVLIGRLRRPVPAVSESPAPSESEPLGGEGGDAVGGAESSIEDGMVDDE